MKIVSLPYGSRHIELAVPDSADVSTPPPAVPLSAADAVRRSLTEPIGSARLSELAISCRTAAVVVSDNTRPVPYKGSAGILEPILEILKQQHVAEIKIIVATGTHRPMTGSELKNMLGPAAFGAGIRVINHVATDPDMLRSIGRTDRTAEVTVNRHYLDADLKIITGLVEPHFMAGFSGGRKAVCPGICGLSVSYGFHSASILDHPRSTTLILDGNPCHNESLRIAEMAGVDFAVNVTLDSQKRLTGIFSGQLQQSHQLAVEHLCHYATVRLQHPYDLVITQTGDVGVNHYQCAKAAYEVARVISPIGSIVMLGDLADLDPVGSRNYKDVLAQLARLGTVPFLEKIVRPDWVFIPEQWQVQMWAQVFVRTGTPRNVFLCAAQLEDYPTHLTPDDNVAARSRRPAGCSNLDFTRQITQDTIGTIIKANPDARILVHPDGPYTIPILQNPDSRPKGKIS